MIGLIMQDLPLNVYGQIALTHMNITLKRAGVEDVENYIKIEKSVKSSLNLVTIDTAEAQKEIEDSIVYMIAFEEQVVGLVSYEIKGDTKAHIAEIAVNPDFQGKGIGRRAMEMILEELRTKSFTFVDLETHPDNPALRLYESLGFSVVGRVENYKDSGTPRLVLSRNL